MLPLTVSGQPLEISLERLGQPMSLYVPLSKGTLGANYIPEKRSFRECFRPASPERGGDVPTDRCALAARSPLKPCW